MFFAGISRDERTPLAFLSSGFRLNAATYRDERLIPLQEGLPD